LGIRRRALRRVASPLDARTNDLYPVVAFVAALVVVDGFAVRFPSRDAGLYRLVFQRISGPVSIIVTCSPETSAL
jgi:hypothetical protein